MPEDDVKTRVTGERGGRRLWICLLALAAGQLHLHWQLSHLGRDTP